MKPVAKNISTNSISQPSTSRSIKAIKSNLQKSKLKSNSSESKDSVLLSHSKQNCSITKSKSLGLVNNKASKKKSGSLKDSCDRSTKLQPKQIQAKEVGLSFDKNEKKKSTVSQSQSKFKDSRKKTENSSLSNGVNNPKSGKSLIKPKLKELYSKDLDADVKKPKDKPHYLSKKNSIGKCKASDSRNVKHTQLKPDTVKSKEMGVSFAEIEKKIFEGFQTESELKNPIKKNRTKKLSQVPSTPSNKPLIQLNERLPNGSSTPNKQSKNKSLDRKKLKNATDEQKERRMVSSKQKTKGNSFNNSKLDSNSDVSDWEDVDELSEILKSNENSKNISKDVQIELEAGNVLWGIKRRKKRTEQELIEDYIRKQVNRSTKEVYVNMHKAHLLCLLAHGMYINSCLSADSLLSLALSIIPKNYFTPKRIDLSHLEKFVTWFCKCISIKNDESELTSQMSFNDVFSYRFKDKYASSYKELVIMFVTTSRAVGMTVRLVQSLTPLSWKPPSDTLIKPPKNLENSPDEGSSILTPPPIVNCDSKKKKEKEKSRKMLSTDSDIDSNELSPKSKSKSKKKLKPKPSSDDEFAEIRKFRKHITSKSKSKEKANSNKRESSEVVNEGNKKPKKETLTEWAEVYVEEEEKWISVDVARCKIHCAQEIEARCSNLSYVVAFNPDQTVKDVTKRYVSNWLSAKDKIQCDGKWWTQSLRPFLGKRDRRDREEDKDLEVNLRMQPLPKALSDYKNHPLYALQRHLLKFEAIYPPDESPVGFFRGEPVFPRSSVKTLCGREQWIKEAKTVRVDEEPYKVVKARPKWDKSSCQVIKDRPLELFGEWQVEDYEPPIAKNGKVPRNEYGNVELFKPCMLPKGCLHLPVNGLNRIARKLNIDCAPALVGFEFHSGGSHPVYDGFVVCEEFKDIMMDAWNQEQFEQAKKEEEKRLKRIYDNWKRLISGITLKDRLKERYGITPSQEDTLKSENSEENTKQKKKIKQEDLDSLSTTLITHAVPNLKIDFSTGIATKRVNRTGGRKRGRDVSKRSGTTCSTGGVATGSQNARSVSSSSDSETEANSEKKREKIRTILQWNPETVECQSFGPALSDESDLEEGASAELPLRLSSATPSARMSPELLVKKSLSKRTAKKKGSSKTNIFKNQRKKITVKNDDDELALSSDSESSVEDAAAVLNPVQKRRPLRNRNAKGRQINYTESDGRSEPDISVDESDTSDKTYNPLAEVTQQKRSILSDSD